MQTDKADAHVFVSAKGGVKEFVNVNNNMGTAAGI